MVAAADAMTTGKRFSAGLPPVPAAITMLSLVATRRGQPPQAGQVHERTSKLAFHRPVEQHFLTFPLHTLGPAHISRDSGPPGSASEECDHVKSRDHKDHNHPGYTFIPASVETCGFWSKPLASYLRVRQGFAAAWGSAVTGGVVLSYLGGAHCECRVTLVRCQGAAYRDSANLCTRAARLQSNAWFRTSLYPS